MGKFISCLDCEDKEECAMMNGGFDCTHPIKWEEDNGN